jgi:hypothetical protein
VNRGPVYSKLTLSNPVLLLQAKIEFSALVDTDTLHLCKPDHLAIQLDLKILENREVTLADRVKNYKYKNPFLFVYLLFTT